MSDPSVYPSVEAAWRALLDDVLRNGDDIPAVVDPMSVGSRFGRTSRLTREAIARTVVVQNPRNRLLSSPIRGYRLEFAVGVFLHALSETDDIQPLLFYNNKGTQFSDDGRTQRSALGPRIFGKAGQSISQFDAAIRRLTADPASRRAYLQIYFPSDTITETRDVSCTGSLHLLLRPEGRLAAIGQMRSQSVLMVMPYDLFLLTMIHEYASVRLGIPLGRFTHICNSAHLYADELPMAQAVVGESCAEAGAMPPMTAADLLEIPAVLAAEKNCREALRRDPATECTAFLRNLPAYWQDMFGALCVGWKLRQGIPPDEVGIEKLASPYRECMQATATRSAIAAAKGQQR